MNLNLLLWSRHAARFLGVGITALRDRPNIRFK